MFQAAAILYALATTTSPASHPPLSTDLPLDRFFDGIDVPDIIGGTAHNGHPAVAAVLALDADGLPIGICSGTLITPQHVLTAAHCVEGALGEAGYAVYFGTTLLDDPDPGAIMLTVASEVVVHERWNRQNLGAGFDIAIITLRDPAPSAIAPIAFNRIALSDQSAGTAVSMVGWGNTGLPGDEGRKRIASSALTGVLEALLIVDIGLTGACSGDSGGPLLIESSDGPVIAGLTSFGDEGCNEYVAYTRVDALVDWIDAQLGVTPVDPSDVPTQQPPPPTADDEGDDSEPSAAPAGTETTDVRVVGGCQAAAGGATSPLAILLALLWLVARRRQRFFEPAFSAVCDAARSRD